MTVGRTILIHKGGDTNEPSNFRMIALTSCLIKPLHLIMARKLENFLVSNEYLDPKVQKGFMSKISGCIEHTTVPQELLPDAKFKKKTIHITAFDLQHAFGSVAHSLMEHTMEYHKVPMQVRTYMKDLYPKIKTKIVTDEWETDEIRPLIGIF